MLSLLRAISQIFKIISVTAIVKHMASAIFTTQNPFKYITIKWCGIVLVWSLFPLFRSTQMNFVAGKKF
jgi:hypothetical protein